MKILSIVPHYNMGVSIVNQDSSIEFADVYLIQTSERAKSDDHFTNTVVAKQMVVEAFRQIKRDHEITHVIIEEIQNTNPKYPASGHMVACCVFAAQEVFELEPDKYSLGDQKFRWSYLGLMPDSKAAAGQYTTLRQKLVQMIFEQTGSPIISKAISNGNVRESLIQAYYRIMQLDPKFEFKKQQVSSAAASQHK